MRETGDQSAPHPIIIVRRRRGEEGGHHGGVWKIAYADFMTAMMAFFLVMWLINMTDDKTIVQVANYFNPMRLSDKNPSSKGVHDGTAKSHSEETESPAEGAGKETRAEKKKKQRDLEIFTDVKAHLDELAAKAVAVETPAGSSPLAGADIPRKDTDQMRDPFDPVRHAPGNSTAQTTGLPYPRTVLGNDPPPPGGQKGDEDTAGQEPDKVPQGGQVDQVGQKPAEKVAEGLLSELADVQKKFSESLPQLEIRVVPEGVLISLTDKSNVSMFAVGSADPRPEAVVLITRIGEVLRDRKGPIIISGHTDGRAYRNGAYDNWRLSSARAHMTQQMLMRGGLPEHRLAKVEGYADRKPIVPVDKLAFQNRRIDILLQVEE